MNNYLVSDTEESLQITSNAYGVELKLYQQPYRSTSAAKRVRCSKTHPPIGPLYRATTADPKSTEAMDNMRLDFVFRKVGDGLDLFATEDKLATSTSSKVAIDGNKCDKLRIAMLERFAKRLAFLSLISELEIVTAQFVGLELTVQATRKLGDIYVHYTKRVAQCPAVLDGHFGTFAHYLLSVISLKRCVMTNYLKGHIIVETTKANDVDFLSNDSWTVSAITSVELIELNNDRLLQSTRNAIREVGLSENVIIVNDWEFLTMLSLTDETSAF